MISSRNNAQEEPAASSMEPERETWESIITGKPEDTVSLPTEQTQMKRIKMEEENLELEEQSTSSNSETSLTEPIFYHTTTINLERITEEFLINKAPLRSAINVTVVEINENEENSVGL